MSWDMGSWDSGDLDVVDERDVDEQSRRLGFTDEQVAQLAQKLDPRLTKQRQAFDGGKRQLTYLEAHTAISQLNHIFGPDGWGWRVVKQGKEELGDQGAPSGAAVYWAWVEVSVRGKHRSNMDIGTTELRNGPKMELHNPDRVATAMKGAVSDGLKRAARGLGAQLGNELYDDDGDVQRILSGESGQAQTATPAARKTPVATTTASAPVQRPDVKAVHEPDELERNAQLFLARAADPQQNPDQVRKDAVAAANARKLMGGDLKAVIGVLEGRKSGANT